MPAVGSEALSYLPLAHLAERTFSHYLAVRQVCTVTFVRDYHEWDSTTGEMTPTMKLKRPVVTERYQHDVEQLYQAP